MNDYLNTFIENQTLIYAIICVSFAIIITLLLPRPKKKVVKTVRLDNNIIKDELNEIVDDNDTYNKTNEIDNLLKKMEVNLESTPSNTFEYEDELEKTAIISYKELKEKALELEKNTTYNDELCAYTSLSKLTNDNETIKFIDEDIMQQMPSKIEEIEIIEEVEPIKYQNDEEFLNDLINLRNSL